MKIQFLTDFRGRETGERFFQAGQVVELDDDTAAGLIANRRAVSAEPAPEPEPQPAPAPAKGKRK